MKSQALFLILILFSSLNIAQTIQGTVVDANTKQPLQDVSVYFDATTIGTITDKNGVFNLIKKENTNSPLVVSYLGYKTEILQNSKLNDSLLIELEVSDYELDEVLLSDDTWSREKKLRYFKREFLGKSEASLDCEILNESDIVLSYSSAKKILYASSDKPIIIKNKYLGYKIYYSISEFEVQFKNIKHINIKISDSVPRDLDLVNFVFLSGYSRFEEINSKRIKTKYLKRRAQHFKESSLCFMRCLAENKLKENGFNLYVKDPSGKSDLFFETLTERVFNIEKTKTRGAKVTFIKPQKIVVKHNSFIQSSIIPNQDHFFIDYYGVFSPVKSINFSGLFGKERLSTMLPINFSLKD